MYAQNMYQVLLGSTRYRRVYVPKTSSPPTQTAGTQGFHPLNWSPLWNQWAQNIQDVSRHTFDFMIIFQHLKLNLNEVKVFFSPYALHSALPGHHHWRRRRSRLRRKWGAWCWRSGLFWLRVLSTNLFSAIAHYCLASLSIAWYCRHRLWSKVCPLTIKSQLPILGRSKTLR